MYNEIIFLINNLFKTNLEEIIFENLFNSRLIASLSTIDCEICSLSKTNHIIFRCSTLQDIKLYEQVCWNLIQITSAYNNHKWISHIRCDKICMNHVYIQWFKIQSLDIMQCFVRWVYWQYKCVVKIIKLDDEKIMIKFFEIWTARQKITVKRSSPDTSAQNNIAEWSGRMIIRKTCAMRITD